MRWVRCAGPRTRTVTETDTPAADIARRIGIRRPPYIASSDGTVHAYLASEQVAQSHRPRPLRRHDAEAPAATAPEAAAGSGLRPAAHSRGTPPSTRVSGRADQAGPASGQPRARCPASRRAPVRARARWSARPACATLPRALRSCECQTSRRGSAASSSHSVRTRSNAAWRSVCWTACRPPYRESKTNCPGVNRRAGKA